MTHVTTLSLLAATKLHRKRQKWGSLADTMKEAMRFRTSRRASTAEMAVEQLKHRSMNREGKTQQEAMELVIGTTFVFSSAPPKFAQMNGSKLIGQKSA